MRRHFEEKERGGIPPCRDLERGKGGGLSSFRIKEGPPTFPCVNARRGRKGGGDSLLGKEGKGGRNANDMRRKEKKKKAISKTDRCVTTNVGKKKGGGSNVSYGEKKKLEGTLKLVYEIRCRKWKKKKKNELSS